MISETLIFIFLFSAFSDSPSSSFSLNFYPLPGVPSEAYGVLLKKNDLAAKTFAARHEKHFKEQKILVKYKKSEWIQGGAGDADEE